MKYAVILLGFLLLFNCKKVEENKTDETETAPAQTKDLRDFKVTDSKYINVDDLWKPFEADLKDFTETEYNNLKPLILEQDIPTLQKHVQEGRLSYEKLTKFYLYRIRKFDRNNPLSLNSVIALNSKVIEQAIQKDRELRNRMLKRPIFGMPIFLKDNVNASGMPTTAGAVALQNNNANDAFIVKQLKQQGALILGKTNLSEWANYFSENSSNGYSAIGGQTFNAYGRRTMDTGGSSSGSGVTVASNFCVAAVGSETSGSILSPSSQNSVIGLKPTIGLLSRSGIVPISSTLDTPGPMTKNVTDNAIMLEAMLGMDPDDSKSVEPVWEPDFHSKILQQSSINGKRFGAIKRFMEDTLYVGALNVLKQKGAEIIEIEEADIEMEGFGTLLNLDMRNDLPSYLSAFGDPSIEIKSVQDVIDFNMKDSLNRMPYGQKIFEGIVTDSTSEEAFVEIKTRLKSNGKLFFDQPMADHNLDGILSINNFHARYAAAAEYPALTIPMGYDYTGKPRGLTFIAKPFQENKLLQWAYVYEQASKMRKTPKNYD